MHGTRRILALGAAVALGAAACSAAGASRQLPTPRPATVRASGSVSVFPIPDTPTVSPATTISFRDVDVRHLGAISVVGSASGAHDGHVVAHSDGHGVSFVPDRPFTAGEEVTVHTTLSVRGARNGQFAFTIARPVPAPSATATTPPAPAAPPSRDVLSFASRPDLHPPRVSVTKPGSAAGAGDIFLTPNPALGQASAAMSGAMIVDAKGALVWFAPASPGVTILDLSVQRYHGQPVLAFFRGVLESGGYGRGAFELLDSSYRPVGEVHAGNGYATDLHDFVITRRNTALVLAYNPVLAPASALHSSSDRALLDAVVQEIDIPTGSVLFEWHSVGVIGTAESYLPAPASATEPYDYVHPNSIAIDTDGELLLSGRHTSALYKIDRETGTLDWRLGGKRSNFGIAPGADFHWQHDVRVHDEGLLSVFDNASSAPGVTSRSASRGLLLRIDEPALKVTLEQSDANPRNALSYSQGDMQALPNGDWFAGWGSVGEFTEFAPDGRVVLDGSIGAGQASYRALQFAWRGTPARPPAVVAHRSGTTVSVAASWNGATNVARWQILAGQAANALHPISTYAATGFETTMHTAAAGATVVQVRALGAAGRVLGTSEIVAVR